MAHRAWSYPGGGPDAVLVLLSLFGCGGNDLIEPVPVNGPASQQTEIDVTSFGARGNDQLDDTNEFAAAISALPAEGGTIRIPAGTYLFTATPRSSIGRGIDIFRRSNITLAGEGMEQTILRMAPGTSYTGDTHVMLIAHSSGITLRDLMVDGNRSQVSYADEQSHGVAVRGSSQLQFERVRFTGMHGDGMQLLGLLDPTLTWVSQVRVEDCLFTDNGRSGIAVQRAVRDVTVTRSTFTRIQDQAIDMEPSNAEIYDGLGPQDFEITNNRFYDTASLALTITGVSNGEPAQNIYVADNEFDGAGIFIFNAVDVLIERNRIRSGSLWAPIEVRKRSERIRVMNNTIDSRETTDKSAIVLTFHTSAAPKNVYVIGNTIDTAEDGALSSRDAEQLQVTDNTISGSGNYGISIRDIIPDSPLSDFLIENNSIMGYEVGILFVSRGDITSGVCVRGNQYTNVGTGYEQKGPIQRAC